MKALVVLAAGLAACVSTSGESSDGPRTNLTDGGPQTAAAEALPTRAANGPHISPADGSPTEVGGGSATEVGDGSPREVTDGALTGMADGRPNDASDGSSTDVGDGGRTDATDGRLTNVALNGRATASSVWEDDPRFQPENVIDDSTFDDVEERNYWLLPNETAGWWEVDLGAEFKIRTIKIFNCNNDEANDRGTKDFRLEIRDATQEVILTGSGVLPFTSLSSAAQPTVPRVLELESAVRGRYVKIYVDSWYQTRTDPSWPHPTVPSSDPANQGGGLNEVQVFATE